MQHRNYRIGTPKEYRRARHLRLKEEGNCIACAKPRERLDRTRCDTCIGKESQRMSEKNAWNTYKLTPFTKAKLFMTQRCGCPICGKLIVGDMTVDHNHITGKVRGITHPYCNTAIGVIETRRSLVQDILEYLDR